MQFFVLSCYPQNQNYFYAENLKLKIRQKKIQQRITSAKVEEMHIPSWWLLKIYHFVILFLSQIVETKVNHEHKNEQQKTITQTINNSEVKNLNAFLSYSLPTCYTPWRTYNQIIFYFFSNQVESSLNKATAYPQMALIFLFGYKSFNFSCYAPGKEVELSWTRLKRFCGFNLLQIMKLALQMGEIIPFSATANYLLETVQGQDCGKIDT